MPFHLRPSQPATARKRAQIQLSSYANDPLFNSIMPSASLASKLDFFAALLEKDVEKEGVRCLEIVKLSDDDAGEEEKVVAFAQWKYPLRKGKAEEVERGSQQQEAEGKKESKDIGFKGITSFPDGVNIPFLNAISQLSAEMLGKWYVEDEMFYLTYMHVLPSYQQRGLGQLLMRDAIRDADEQGARCYLSASEAGRRLYVKFGFRDVESRVVDFRSLGALGWRRTVGMVREVGGV